MNRREGRKELAKRIIKQAGGTKDSSGREAAAKPRSDHKTNMPTFKDGGHVKGEKPRHRLDRRARGGANKEKGHTAVNIVIAGGKQPQPGLGASMPSAAPMPAAPPRPMPPPMPAQGMPPQGGAMPPRPMMNKGGKVAAMKFGAGGGKGRLEKIKAYGS